MTDFYTPQTPLSYGFLISETHGTGRGRSTLQPLGASSTFTAALVLGQVAATGRMVPLNLAAVDGSAVVAGIAIFPITTGPDAPGQSLPLSDVLVRDATVAAERLTWPAGATPAQIAAGVAQLAALGIAAVPLRRDAMVRLVWPAGATDADVASTLAQLAGEGITAFVQPPANH